MVKKTNPNLFAPAFTPTDEQKEILSAFKNGESLKIHAFAGTGKTATLTYLAGETDKRGIYLAFNRRIASEAKGKMPPNVEVRTVHSLAWRWAATVYKQDKLIMRPAHNQVYPEIKIPAQLQRIYHRIVVKIVLKTVERFCQSGDKEVKAEHLPWDDEPDAYPLGRDEAIIRQNGKFFVETAFHIWQKMTDANEEEIPLGHDGYLKLWSLSNPRIMYSFLFIDEAQDLNPVMLKILDCYSGQKIIVGDGQQQIYLWRGAVNAMEHKFNARDFYLTRTFRFGEKLADMANSVLHRLEVAKKIVSAGGAGTQVIIDAGTDIIPNAYLFRKNLSIIQTAFFLFKEKKKYHIVDPNGHILTLVEDYFRLNDGL